MIYICRILKNNKKKIASGFSLYNKSCLAFENDLKGLLKCV